MISRTSAEAYRNTGKSIAQIGTELNVDPIVERSVTKAGDQVRVVVQRIDGRSHGNFDRAFEMMTALRAANNLPPNLAFDPPFPPLRADARYANLVNPEPLEQ